MSAFPGKYSGNYPKR
jgi:mRNA interferase MazF